MKKSLTFINILGLSAIAAFAGLGNGYTGSPTPSILTVTLSPATPVIALTNNVTIQGVSFLTPSGVGTVSAYDANSTNAPYYGTNYVTSSYVSRVGYATNYITSFVGYNGYTNWYTNSGYWTATITNAAATNQLTPQGVFPVISGVVSTYNTPSSYQLGVSLVATTNTTAIIYYTPNK